MKPWPAFGLLAATVLAWSAIGAWPVRAEDPNRHPDWRGQWVRIGAGTYDPSKPPGRGQEPPLTPDYQAIWERSLAAEDAGLEIHNPQAACRPAGLPRAMVAFEPFEIIVTPGVTFMMMSYMTEFRRIFTDGRSWPKDIEPTYMGFSLGTWQDSDGDGRYDTLLIESRGFKGPRVFEANGLPLHPDNESVVKEKLFADKADQNLLHNEITTIDHVLTKPWTITRHYRRAARANWIDYFCAEDNQHVRIGAETYLRSADGLLMPTRKDQKPPDLSFFNRPK